MLLSKQRVMYAQVGTVMWATDQRVAILLLLDHTHRTGKKLFVNVDIPVLVQTHRKLLVQQARTPITRAPSLASPVRRVNLRVRQAMTNARIVPLDIYNLTHNNQTATESPLEALLPQVGRRK